VYWLKINCKSTKFKIGLWLLEFCLDFSNKWNQSFVFLWHQIFKLCLNKKLNIFFVSIAFSIKLISHRFKYLYGKMFIVQLESVNISKSNGQVLLQLVGKCLWAASFVYSPPYVLFSFCIISSEIQVCCVSGLSYVWIKLLITPFSPRLHSQLQLSFAIQT